MECTGCGIGAKECGFCADNVSDSPNRLIGCPFCDAQTREIDGDYLVKHEQKCFLSISSNGFKETWIVGKRAKEAWRKRMPNIHNEPKRD